MKLIIFDLDQTIVELFSFHNKATTETFKKVFNVKARLDEIDFAGKTLENNIEELAKLKKINKEEIKKKLPQVIEFYGKIFIQNLPSRVKPFILPGVSELIKKLYADKNNILVVVTGDSRTITKTILKRANLLRYFAFLVTGEKEKKRVKLVRKAFKQARIMARRKRERVDKVIVIGDSIHDIKSGKAIGATTIAVLTGFHSRAQLKQAGADYIFKNLADYKRIIQTVEK